MGWRQEGGQARVHDEPGYVGDHGGREFLGCPRALHGRLKRSPTRKKIFSWIEAHQKTFYLPRSPIHPVGVYFSSATRNYFADEFIRSYRGILILLMQKHLEFRVVTPARWPNSRATL